MKSLHSNLVLAAALLMAPVAHPSDAGQPASRPEPQGDAIGKQVAAAEEAVRAELRDKNAPLRVIEAKEVNWPSGALGCPNPGSSYIDVVTPGYLIVIDAEGTTFYLHAGLASAPFVCPAGRRQPPLQGRPGDVAY